MIDRVFAGSIPKLYDAYLVPLIFEPYATDLAERVTSRSPSRVLEIAAGTGVVTRALALRLPRGVAIVATDLNQAMLDQAAAVGAACPVEWRRADAMQLPFADGRFDAVVCQFGVMFFPDKTAGYREARRVLKPGGRFLCLEFSKVNVPGLDTLYDAYSFKLLPKMGQWVAGDADSYRYLAESIRRFPPPDQFARMIGEAGLDQVKVRTLSGGIAAMHSAWRI